MTSFSIRNRETNQNLHTYEFMMGQYKKLAKVTPVIQTQNNQHVNFFSELEAGKYINFIRRGEGGCKIGHFYICINFENEKFILILLFTQNFVKLYFQEKLVLRLKTRKEKLKKRKNKKNTKRKWEF